MCHVCVHIFFFFCVWGWIQIVVNSKKYAKVVKVECNIAFKHWQRHCKTWTVKFVVAKDTGSGEQCEGIEDKQEV